MRGFLAGWMVAAGWLAVASYAAGGEPPPNIVLLLVDDLGYRDLGCFGGAFYETPAIDRLAGTGVRLTSAYAACPVCSPTRASIMTGKYPARLAATDWFGADQPEEWGRNTRLLPAPYKERLPAEETTLAEALGEAGYATFFAGKWHLGPEGSWPEDHGFQVNRGGCEWGHPKGPGRYFSPYGNPRLEDGPVGEHLTARLAGETARFIRRSRDRPFFAFLSFYTVHLPLQSPPALREKYRAKRDALGAAAERWGEEGGVPVRRAQSDPEYAGMVESLDNAVGVVLEALTRSGVEDNTIVMLTSDNGGLATRRNAPTSNAPLRAGKGWMYEGGVRVPTIVRWPGVTRPGSECDAPLTSTDYFPTLLDAAGLAPRPAQHVDGESFAAALRGGPRRRGPVYWHYPHYGNQGGRPAAAVRDGRWKLIEWYEGNRLELFDLSVDQGETQDLAQANPREAARLKRMLDAWRAEVRARLPTANPNYREE